MIKKILLLTCLAVAAQSVVAQSQVTPIVELSNAKLLGGVQNGKFVSAKFAVKQLKPASDYTRYTLDGKTEKLLKLKKPTNTCPENPSYGFEFSETQSEKFAETGGVALGSGIEWNPLPRITKPIALSNADYKTIVGDFLKSKGIANPIVVLKQAIKIDLEGDGTDEVLLKATRFVHYAEKDGKKKFDEYSVVLLRKKINGKQTTIFLTGEVVLKNAYDFDVDIPTISSILDLNGDGKLEMVIYSGGDESSSNKVFEMVGNKALQVKTLSTEDNVDCY